MRKFTRRDWYIVGALTLAALLLRFINLSFPHEIVFDETYFANFAHDYLTHTRFFDAEPPLGKFLIAGGIKLFGFNSFGWRLAPALAGTAVIPLMYLFVKRLFGGIWLPTVAALLTLLDGLLLVESRLALLDIFVVFFNLLTYTLFLLSLQAPTRNRSARWLVLTGFSLGLGLATKWITLAFLGPAVALLLLLAFRNRSLVRRIFKVSSGQELLDGIGAKARNLHHPLTYLALLGVVPFAIYLGLFQLHVPFDSTGGSSWSIHKQIYNYHHTLKASHPYSSKWWTWPLMLRPVAYYFKTPDVAQWQGIVAFGNPIIWWGGVLALFYMAYRFVRTRSLVLGFILLGFLAHFAPWALITRVLFIYHYMGALPFTIIALAYALRESWLWKPKDPSVQLFGWFILFGAAAAMGGLFGRSLLGTTPVAISFTAGALLAGIPIIWLAVTNALPWRWGKKQAVAVIGLALLAFVYFLPVWTGIGLDPADYYRHMWLRSWI